MGDFTVGPPPPEAPPFSLDYDAERDQWTLTIHDHGNHLSAVLPPFIVDQLAERIATEPSQVTGGDGLQAQVTVVEYANLGDCAAYVRRPLTYDPSETVRDLLERAHHLGDPYRRHDGGDRVELQVIPETIPERPGDDWLRPL